MSNQQLLNSFKNTKKNGEILSELRTFSDEQSCGDCGVCNFLLYDLKFKNSFRKWHPVFLKSLFRTPCIYISIYLPNLETFLIPIQFSTVVLYITLWYNSIIKNISSSTSHKKIPSLRLSVCLYGNLRKQGQTVVHKNVS